MGTPLVFEDSEAVAFRDIHPQAPVHLLIIPRQHVESVGKLTASQEALVGHLVMVAQKLAKQEGLFDGGFRIVMNTGANAGQTVFHLHVHLLGGRSFSWPPG